MRTLSVTLLALALTACTGAPAEAPQAEASTKTEASTQTEASTKTAAAAPETAQAKVTTASVGQAAPDFTLTDLDGTTHTLSDYKGKTVVLEWFNPGCPFVVAAHEGGPLKDMAGSYMDKGVVWLSVNSGAPGKQGHGVDTNKAAVADWAMPNPVLVDESGDVGRAYGARTTPHMYVIAPDGTLAYAGALDNAPRNDKPDSGYIPFTQQAIDAVLAGQDVSPSQTQPWGCSVKYGS